MNFEFNSKLKVKRYLKLWKDAKEKKIPRLEFWTMSFGFGI